MVYTVYRAYCAQMAIVRDRERHIVETEALHLRTIEGLAMAVEAKDSNTHRHLMRVRVYVSEIGKIMGLDKPIMQALLTAAYLHDIGKLAVPEYIINKPGRLTPQEFEKMKIHPVVGADILERVHFPYPVVPIVRSHHEAWDGSGYPDGLAGEQIPIGARILTAVDCFDALASDRPYRKAMSIDDAMAFVKSKAGVQFDSAVVSLLAEHYPRLEEMARKQIEEVEPLKTDLFIERGAAPGAGFEPQQPTQDSGRRADTGRPEGNGLPAEKKSSRRPGSEIPEDESANSILEIKKLFANSLSARTTVSTMGEHLQAMIPFDCLAVYLKRGERISALCIDGRFARAFTTEAIPVGEGLSGWVVESGRAIVNGNPTVEPNFLAGCALFSAESSALSVPLIDSAGAIFGAITLYSCAPAAFSKDHLQILEAIQSKSAQEFESEPQHVLAGA
jgi:putative nucleotidyltransferase with HDIG domain